jgi:hypothetical protein
MQAQCSVGGVCDGVEERVSCRGTFCRLGRGRRGYPRVPVALPRSSLLGQGSLSARCLLRCAAPQAQRANDGPDTAGSSIRPAESQQQGSPATLPVREDLGGSSGVK